MSPAQCQASVERWTKALNVAADMILGQNRSSYFHGNVVPMRDDSIPCTIRKSETQLILASGIVVSGKRIRNQS